MGYSGIPAAKIPTGVNGKPDIIAAINNTLTFRTAATNHKVLASAIVKNVHYAAVMVTDTTGNSNTPYVFAAITHLRFNKRNDFPVLYKPMTEEDGPIYTDCPLKILDKLTPTSDAIANTWRADCLKTHEQRMMTQYIGNQLARLKPGTSIRATLKDGHDLVLHKKPYTKGRSTSLWFTDDGRQVPMARIEAFTRLN